MALTVAVDHPAYPADTDFAITGLGVIPNGGSIEVNEEQERSYIAENGKPLVAEDAGNVQITGDPIIPDEEVTALLPPEAVTVEEQSEESPPPPVEESPPPSEDQGGGA